jgi:hypothetical protein
MAEKCYANERELAQCFSQLRIEEEARLAALRSKVRAAIEEEQRKPFDDLDDEWKKYRQASCEFDVALAAGNSKSARFGNCMLTHTQFRVSVLSKYLVSVTTGAYGNGVGLYMFEFGTPTANSEIDPLECSTFKTLLEGNEVAQLRRRGLYREESSRGQSYMNVDIDGDDISDQLIVGCSSSPIPADPCTASVKLSTGKQQFFQFEFGEGYSLMRIGGRVYAVTNLEKPGQRSIVAFDRDGIRRVCTKL